MPYNSNYLKITLANPRGFCAGVHRAIAVVDCALERFGPPIFVRHEVVHNRFVVANLKQRGAVFVDEIDSVEDGSIVIFSAHGVSQTVRKNAEDRDLRIFDATCPLVTKVHMEVMRCSKEGFEVILIGHAGHPEVEGTMGQYCPNQPGGGIYLLEHAADVPKLKIKNPQRVTFVTQTTLSMDDTAEIIAALRRHLPDITGPKKDDICYATQSRQEAVKALTEQCDIILVIGSANSSNSNRLQETALKHGCVAYLIDGADDIQRHWLEGKHHVGITAGASAPDILIEKVVAELKTWGGTMTDYADAASKDTVVFPLPKELRD